MITILNPGQQFKYEPISENIQKELIRRESDKLRMINKVPFIRLSCLQKLNFVDKEVPNKKNNIKEIENKLNLTDELGNRKREVDGFTLDLTSDFDGVYGSRQIIGKELKTNKKLFISNPRRVPPPRLIAFTAQNGEQAGFYTTANLQFTVNSKEQLEFITPFLLHPGNTIIVEFGYSDEDTTMKESLFSYSDIEGFLEGISFDEVRDDENDDRVTSPSFFKTLEDKIERNEGNYEYVVAVINNFDFKLNQDFGFDVTIDMWSISKTRMSSPDENTIVEDNTSETSPIIISDELSKLEQFISDLEKGDKTRFEFQPIGINTQPLVRNNTPSVLRYDEKDEIINLNTTVGSKKYVRLKPIFDYLQRESGDVKFKDKYLVTTNPLIVSNNKAVVFFNKRHPTLKNIPYSSKTREFKLDKLLDNITYVNVDKLVDESSIGIELKTESSNISGRRIERVSGYKLTFNSLSPYIFDNEDPGKQGDIMNIYYDVETLKNHYKRADAKIVDVVKRIIGDINAVTSNIWQLNFVEGVLTDVSKNEPPVTQDIVSFSSRTVSEEDRKKTYTFKFNQKQSIVNEATFNLNLEGTVADQIYFESINQTDGDSESTKLNLLFFEKHENGIVLTDKRNERLSSLQKQRNSTKGGDSNDTLAESKTEFDLTYAQLYDKHPTQNINLLSTSQIRISQLKSQFSALINFEREDRISIDNEENTQENIIQRKKESFLKNFEKFPLLGTDKKIYTKALELNNFLPSKNNKDEEDGEDKPTLGGVNPLLESEVTITMPGLGGFRPLQFFNTDGLPDIYDKRGDFCILNVIQTITPIEWTTNITSKFRINNG